MQIVQTAQAAPPPANPNPAANLRLDKAAHEFEAMLLQEMLKPLSQHGTLTENNGEDNNANPMESFGIQAIAGSLSKSGAIGFADRIRKSLEHRTAAATHPSPGRSRG